MFRIFSIIIIILIAFGFLFFWQGIYLPEVSELEPKSEKIFSIDKGENVFKIASDLKDEELIKSKYFFIVYLVFSGKARKIQAGSYSIDSSMNIAEIAKKIHSGDVVKIKITIPEGFSLKQIEAELSSKLRKNVFINLKTKEFRNEFNFLRDTSEEANLEGFLFPDTYIFKTDESEKEIARKLLANFDKKISSDLEEEISRQRKTIFEIITMASLVEKEVKITDDKKIVAGILWKRLAIGMPLQVDATITYLTGKKTTMVSKEETKIDSPYNTYKYRGLPVGPIANPGLESILAVVFPENSNYWYYLSAPGNKTIFSRTLEEHNWAKAKYLR